MLKTIKEYIANMPEQDFGSYYQQYIVEIQNDIISRDLHRAAKAFNSVEDSVTVIKGINQLTEELKRLW